MNYKNGYNYSNIESSPINMNISQIYGYSSDPEVFGPPYWYVLHNGAISYPNNPTDYVKLGMQNLLLYFPLLMPCVACKEHAFDFIRITNLNLVTRSREDLFKFTIDLHNYVNKRLNKKQFSLDAAKEFYGYNKAGIGPVVKITYS
jgi:hypothetical protein